MEKFVVRRKRKIDEDSSEDVIKREKSYTHQNEDTNASRKATSTLKVDMDDFLSEDKVPIIVKWRKLRGDNLCCDYGMLFNKSETEAILKRCESEIIWNTGKTAQVQLFGKWMDIPRKQSAYGDPGLSYNFSGNTVPARPWCPLTHKIKNFISKLVDEEFNFVLINRYKDGDDYMGFHKDDEKDLDEKSSIASLSFGQTRDFVFKHENTKKKVGDKHIRDVSLTLENGSLLMMRYPTNRYWYHALPKRKKALGVRINMTFRKMMVK